jgi:multisite-specific tRNA:(cytosine-C5)-methyltransferase
MVRQSDKFDRSSVGLTSKDSIRIYPHLQDTGGFFIAVLRSIASPKYGSMTPSGMCAQIKHPREGKRAANEVADVSEVKKARLDGDDDVLMAVATEISENRRMRHSKPSR